VVKNKGLIFFGGEKNNTEKLQEIFRPNIPTLSLSPSLSPLDIPCPLPLSIPSPPLSPHVYTSYKKELQEFKT